VTPFGPIGSDSSGRSAAILRVDLHVHSRYSGPGHLRPAGARSGLGEPGDIYRTAKARGMDLVTLTDLDSIEGCLRFIEAHPGVRDFLISEEVTSRDPRTHRTYRVLVYGLDERQHREITRHRKDIRDLAGYLDSEGVAAGLGSGPADAGHGVWVDALGGQVLDLFPLVEIKSGAHGRRHNDLAARLLMARRAGAPSGAIGGSCAHGPLRVGTTWTAAHATGVGGFLAALRAGRTWAGGDDGGVWVLSRDLSRTLARECMERPRRLLGLPLGLLGVPLRHALGHARHAAHVRRRRHALDLDDLMKFQRKASTYILPARAAGRIADGDSDALVHASGKPGV
jgi:hypothetical protein